MKRALTFGAFDLLHYGHLRLLARIKNMADRVIVGLATDELIMANGKEPPLYPFMIRREMLLHTRYVDEVIPHGGPIDGAKRVKLIAAKIEAVRNFRVDLVVMGDDWRGEYDFLRPYCEIAYLDRTPDVSTQQIRAKLVSIVRSA